MDRWLTSARGCLVLGAVAAATLALADPSAGLSGRSAVARHNATRAAVVLSRARRAVLSVPGVHIVSVDRDVPSGRKATIVADLGRHVGTQLFLIGNEVARVILTPTHAYLAGNRAGLIGFFGFPPAVAKEIGDRWVSTVPGTAEYRELAAGDTVGALLGDFLSGGQQLTMRELGPCQARTRHLSWRLMLPGVGRVTETLVLPAHRPYPLRARERSGKRREEIVFSRWGEWVRVSDPRGAIRFSSLVS